MDAVRYRAAGGTEVLEFESIDRPEPGFHEVLVEIQAASVNPVDAKIRARREPVEPKTSGSDLAGIVTAIGEGITEFETGDRVFATGLHTARFDSGSFAEYASVPRDLVAKLPEEVSFEEGAAVALVGVTAWRAFVDHARLEPGGSVFVHGGNGGVGHVAIGLASAMGANVACTARPEYENRLTTLGAETVVDYVRDDIKSTVASEFGSADIVLDHMPETYLGTDVELANFGGDIVIIAGPNARFPDASAARSKELDIHMMSMSNLATNRELPELAPILEHLGRLLADDRLEVLIDQRLPLDEAAESHRAVLEESVLGKIIVIP